ncbi:HFR059Wp [Eremothecium sinecaudum]|uniref:HFR059Wp n=1 Tax=Eremothecium sinecaudum TaxID=45286 RepID=A0A0X8HUT0_9SACH|nr:HFR059Wp [Eremothecium sinecaudum]AMD21914.1 HFR059Wp [Eremothecium sinecaudum]
MTQECKKSRLAPSYRIQTLTHATSHPLGVKPSGNALLEGADPKERREIRSKNLGTLADFPEELLMELFSYILDPKTLHSFACASRMLYAYTYDEDIWRKLYMREYTRLEYMQRENKSDKPIVPFGCSSWKGTWRNTLLKLEPENEALIQTNNTLYSDMLYRPYQCSQIDYLHIFRKIIDYEKASHELGYNLNKDFGIDRFSESDFDQEKFENKYIDKPFILHSQENNGRWPVWSIDDLAAEYQQVSFRQESVKWTLSNYASYSRNNRDESPLYLFDCNSEAMNKIKDSYESPDIFHKDFFRLFQEDGINCRPDHRWLIVGPARSGSTFHKDPNNTSAWNTVLSGMKLWIMLPPHVKPPGVSTDSEEEEVTSPVGIAEWVLSGYYNDAVKMAQNGDCLIGITFPGECIYVPSGWWHTVINLTDTVALTENFVPQPILPKVLNFLKNKPKQLSGFHFKDLADSIEAFLTQKGDGIKNQEHTKLLQEFVNYRDIRNFDNEDCGILSDCTVKPPIYEFLVELLAQSKNKDCLSWALEKAAKLESIMLREKKLNSARENVKVSELWSNLTKQADTAFSFGFTEQ